MTGQSSFGILPGPFRTSIRPCEMKIRVYAASFCSFEDIDEDGTMVLPDGAVLNDVYKRLKVPWFFRRIVFATVNYKRVSPETRLKDGDVVSFFSALKGG